jgi:uncharacterized membrane protein YeaQ/YmgE (transglycosylase-associated protein family)
MEQQELLSAASVWAHNVLEWVGFGTLAGLLAKAIMPGKDPGGAVATLTMGVGGSVIGCGILAFFMEDQRISPISPAGFAVAVAGAFIILFFYKFLGGYWFQEDEGPLVRKRTRRAPRGRQTVVYEED